MCAISACHGNPGNMQPCQLFRSLAVSGPAAADKPERFRDDGNTGNSGDCSGVVTVDGCPPLVITRTEMLSSTDHQAGCNKLTTELQLGSLEHWAASDRQTVTVKILRS